MSETELNGIQCRNFLPVGEFVFAVSGGTTMRDVYSTMTRKFLNRIDLFWARDVHVCVA